MKKFILTKVFIYLSETLKTNYLGKRDLSIRNTTKNVLSDIHIWNINHITHIVFKYCNNEYSLKYYSKGFFVLEKLTNQSITRRIKVTNNRLIFLAAQVIHNGNIIVND